MRGVGVPESEGKATWSGFLGKLRATTRSPFNIQPNRPGSDRNFVLESFTRDFAQRSEAFDFALCRYRGARLLSAYLLIRPLPPNFSSPAAVEICQRGEDRILLLLLFFYKLLVFIRWKDEQLSLTLFCTIFDHYKVYIFTC